MNYLETAKSFYQGAALEPDEGLCCTTSPVWTLPELAVPERMLDMNYGAARPSTPGTWPTSPPSCTSKAARGT